MIAQKYMELPHDLSGSMSKNRFRNELMWGLWEIFDIYDSVENFTMVFDYICDIELHLENELKIFQLKTRNSSAPYTITQLTNHKPNANSILGKIFIIKCKACKGLQIKVAVVSNVNFTSTQKEYTDVIKVAFSSLDEKTQKAIIEKLKSEFPKEKINLSDMFYIRTHIDLESPKDTIIGKMISFYKESKGFELKKPYSLYMSLYDTIEEKACYEFEPDSYDDLVCKKGVTKELFDDIVLVHTQVSDNSVEKAKNSIEKQFEDNYKQKLVMLKALSTVVTGRLKDKELQKKEHEISKFISLHLEKLPNREEDIVEYMQNVFSNNFLTGYNGNDLQAFIILILKQLEESTNE